jgi:hypothetical protein
VKIKYLFFGLASCLAVVCDGGSPKVLNVPVARLIDHPERYNNKTVSVVGYYWFDGHAPVLATDAQTARASTVGRSRIFLDLRNSPTQRSSLPKVHAGYVAIIGTFQYRKMTVTRGKEADYITPGFGWMSDYERQITNITSFGNVGASMR